jgi:PKHD-type hydroxylase
MTDNISPFTDKNTFNLLLPKKGLTNFYYFKNALNNEMIERVINLIPSNLEDGKTGGKVDKSYRSSKIYWIPKNENTVWLYKHLIYFIQEANKIMWNFNISNLWDDLQFTVYDSKENGNYDWHMDIGTDNTSNRKISLTIQLSDESEYEGGDLEFMLHRNIIKSDRTKGTIILFPSYLQHRVTPVTKGIRKSLVVWIYGPAFS